MLVRFFLLLRSAGVPATITELMTLLEALARGLGQASAERFYHLARTCLVKDERYYDRFDRAFAAHFKGAEDVFAQLVARAAGGLARENAWCEDLTDEEKAQIEALGGWDKLMETLKKRLEEQKGRHQGGNKWIGTAGTSPFGAYGYNPEGVRIGQDGSRNRSAVKVWDKREFANLDDGVELGTRNMKLALRRLRKFARRGAPTELALHDTIDATARSGGWLDIKMVPERHNVVKVLLLLDIGGSMDDHVKTCEELFSAARSEFKHLEHFYFHNCPYEALWRDNRRRFREHIGTVERDAHLRRGLQTHLRGRCHHEPVRDRAPGRQRRALERRAGRRVARAPDAEPTRNSPGSIRSRRRAGARPPSDRRSSARSSRGACIR